MKNQSRSVKGCKKINPTLDEYNYFSMKTDVKKKKKSKKKKKLVST